MNRAIFTVLVSCAVAATASAETPKTPKTPPPSKPAPKPVPKPKVITKAMTNAKAWLTTMVTSKDVVVASADKPIRLWILGDADACDRMYEGAAATKPDEVKKLKLCLQAQTKGRTFVEKDLDETDLDSTVSNKPDYVNVHKKMRAHAKDTTIVEATYEGGDGSVWIKLGVAADGTVRVIWLDTPSHD